MKIQAYVEGAHSPPEKEVFLKLQSSPNSQEVDLVLVDRNGAPIASHYLLRIVVGQWGKLALERIACTNHDFVEWDNSGLGKIREV